MASKNPKQVEEMRAKLKPLSAGIMSLPQPPLRKAEEYLEAYSGYAYTAISAIAQEVASIELRLFKVKHVLNGQPRATQIFEHPILSFLQYANPIMTIYDLIEATQTYQDLQGEAFWAVLKDNEGLPQEAWVLRPDWIKIVPDADSVIGKYIYMPGGVPTDKFEIPKENMIPFKYFNPKNPYRGKGSVQAAAMPLDIYTFAQEWNRNFFFNSATPGLVFTTDQKISATAIQRFMTQWKNEHLGRNNSQKVAFLGGGFKLDKSSMAPKDMDFGEQMNRTRDDILAVFKVPKTVLGMTDDVNRANAEATTRAFMERVITPRMKKFVGTLNEFLVPMYGEEGLFLDFVDPAPEDVEQKLKKYESGRKYGWLTANEIRAEEGLKPVEGGDTLESSTSNKPETPDSVNEDEPVEPAKGLVAEIKKIFTRKTTVSEQGNVTSKDNDESKEDSFKHMMPIPVKRPEVLKREKLTKILTEDLTKMIGSMLREKNYEEKLKKQHEQEIERKRKELSKKVNKFQLDKEARDEHWRQFVSKTDEYELSMKLMTVRLFDVQEKTIISNLNGLKDWKTSVVKDMKGRESSLLQSIEDMVKPWIATIVPFIREIVVATGREAMHFVGVGGEIDLTSDPAVEFLRHHAVELMHEINETTREKLKKTLADGFEKGESIPQLSKRVHRVFIEATTTRANLIARSEVLRASNFGTNEGYRQSGVVTGKEWLTALDPDVCPHCEALDGKIVEVDGDFFKKGDTFKVDGKTMKFTLFDVTYPPLHPACRCTLIPVVLE